MTGGLVARLTLLCTTVPYSIVAQTQDNIQRLEGPKDTGVLLDIETVPQGGAHATALKVSLKQVKLPPGFEIDLRATVSDMCYVAIGPNIGVAFVGTHKIHMWAVSNRIKNRVTDGVEIFAPSVSFKIPNGLRFSLDDVLYVVEWDRALTFPAVDSFYENPDVATTPIVPQGELIPVKEESSNHTARVCRIDPDDKLHITLGSLFNVPPEEKVILYDRVGVMDIIRMDRNDKRREAFAHGVHNSIGMDFNPRNKTLWFTDSQVDGTGNDVPPSELNHATRADEDFGFPQCDGGHIRTVECKSEMPSSGMIFPQVKVTAHAAGLDITFYKGEILPVKHQGGMLSTRYGSWNHITPVGAHIIHMPVKADGAAGETEVFVEGRSTSDNKYLGRPADVATLSDGSLLISDDYAGTIYRVSYTTEQEAVRSQLSADAGSSPDDCGRQRCACQGYMMLRLSRRGWFVEGTRRT